MPEKKEVRDYFKSLIHPNEKVKTCHRCGRLTNYERVIIKKKGKKPVVTLQKLKIPIKLLKWHKFKICESCYEDKQEHIIAPKVDLEHAELFNLTYAYIHKQL